MFAYTTVMTAGSLCMEKASSGASRQGKGTWTPRLKPMAELRDRDGQVPRRRDRLRPSAMSPRPLRRGLDRVDRRRLARFAEVERGAEMSRATVRSHVLIATALLLRAPCSAPAPRHHALSRRPPARAARIRRDRGGLRGRGQLPAGERLSRSRGNRPHAWAARVSYWARSKAIRAILRRMQLMLKRHRPVEMHRRAWQAGCPTRWG